MLVNRKALKQITGLQGDDVLLVLQENTNQANAGNKGITVDNFVTAIESELNDVTGNLEVDGVLTVTNTTDSSTKDTGSIITEGGIGVEKSIGLGADLLMQKEVNHFLKVSDTTTTDVNGGNLVAFGGKSNGAGNGGYVALSGGNGGATGKGGAVIIASGFGGTTSGDSGDISIVTPNEGGTDSSGNITISTGIATSNDSGTLDINSGNIATLGTSGIVHIYTGDSLTSGDSGNLSFTTGDATSGVSGDITLDPGTGSSTTVASKTIINDGIVKKPLSSTVASGGTITGKQLVDGFIDATGATGNWQLPTAAQITTAIGATPTGTNFEFIFNAHGMTAANTATLLVGSGMSVPAIPIITGSGTLTVSQSAQVVGIFKVVFDTSTTCKLFRVS